MAPVQVVVRSAAHKGGMEWLVWLTVPSVGGDGLLLGAVETHEAAVEISSALNRLFKMLPVRPT